MQPKVPITVSLIGHNGNAFNILARVRRALKDSGHEEDIAAFMQEALSGDYDNLLRVVQSWVYVV